MARDVSIPVGIPLVVEGAEKSAQQTNALSDSLRKAGDAAKGAQAQTVDLGKALQAKQEAASRTGAALSGMGAIMSRIPGPAGQAGSAMLGLAGQAQTAMSATLALARGSDGLGISLTAVKAAALAGGKALLGLLTNPVVLGFAALGAALVYVKGRLDAAKEAEKQLEDQQRRSAEAAIALAEARSRATLDLVADTARKRDAERIAAVELGRVREETIRLDAAERRGAKSARDMVAELEGLSDLGLADRLSFVESALSGASGEIARLERAIPRARIELDLMGKAGQSHLPTYDNLRTKLGAMDAALASARARTTELTAAQRELAAAASELARAEESEWAEFFARWAESHRAALDGYQRRQAEAAALMQDHLASRAQYQIELDQTMQATENAQLARSMRTAAQMEETGRRVAETWVGVAMGIGSAMGAAFGAVAAGAKSAEEAALGAAKAIASAVLQTAGTAIMAYAVEAAAAAYKANAGIPVVGPLLGAAAAGLALSAVGAFLSQLPTAHEGAVVTGPASQEHLVIVRGQEAIVPLDRGAGQIGRSININISQIVPTSAAEAARSARLGIVPALQRLQWQGV